MPSITSPAAASVIGKADAAAAAPALVAAAPAGEEASIAGAPGLTAWAQPAASRTSSARASGLVCHRGADAERERRRDVTRG